VPLWQGSKVVQAQPCCEAWSVRLDPSFVCQVILSQGICAFISRLFTALGHCKPRLLGCPAAGQPVQVAGAAVLTAAAQCYFAIPA
jgi:hypothetical protein